MVDVTGGDDGRGGATLAGPAAGTALDDRICAATLRCIARAGLRQTTLDDIADEAGCSRATVYRVFPGGWDVLLAATVERELAVALAMLAGRLSATESLDELLTEAINGAAEALVSHAALQYLLDHEPGVVLPHLAFQGLDPLLDRAVAFLAPFLERFLDADRAREAAEWAARLVVLYSGDPAAPLHIQRPDDVRHLVHTYVLPGLVPA